MSTEKELKIPPVLLQKWGKKALEDKWTSVPNMILLRQAELNISNTELVLLINIMSYEHNINALVYPSISTLAKRQGLHERSIQRAINRLVEKGFLTKTIRSKHQDQKGLTNIYSIAPLRAKLEELTNK